MTGVTVSVSRAAPAAGRGRAAASRRRRPRRRRRPPASAQGIQNLLFEGEVRINFDRPTNSLIIVSSLKDYQSLRRVIERLDSPRKQVFVEAMILEVTLDKQRELGASFHGAQAVQTSPGSTTRAWSIGGLNPAKTLFPASALTETMLAGVLGPVLSPDEAREPGRRGRRRPLDIPSFGVLIKALQTNSDVDVLSNPHLLIMNNEDGEISVGSARAVPGQHARPGRRRRAGGRGRSRASAGRVQLLPATCSARRWRWR